MEDEEHQPHEIFHLSFENQLEHILTVYCKYILATTQYEKYKTVGSGGLPGCIR